MFFALFTVVTYNKLFENSDNRTGVSCRCLKRDLHNMQDTRKPC